METLPDLNYDYDALEPYIDARTMEIHYTKHHQGYVNKTNAVLEKYEKYKDTPVLELLPTLNTLDMSEEDKITLRRNGGGHVNHSLFWTLMDPSNNTNDALTQDIIEAFDSVENFKDTFTKEALGRFGSGWAWLVRDADDALQVYSTKNQDSPLLQGHTPIIGLDVWEHAYYLKYQNRRAEYIENWWNLMKII